MQFWKDWFRERLKPRAVQPPEPLDLRDWLDEAFLSPAVHRLAQEATVEGVWAQGREWQVKYQGSLWRARSIGAHMQLAPGDTVYVVARRGNVLLVEAG